MSYNTIEWVYNQTLPAQEKLVLVYIAKCENPNEPCFASVKHLAAKCGVSTRTIQRVLKKLCSNGYLISTPRYRNDGSQTSNFYTVNVAQADRALSPPHDTKLAGGPDSVASPPNVDQVSGLELQNKTKSKTLLQPASSNIRELIYPEGLSTHSKKSVDRILEGIPNEGAQLLLDELAGAMAKGFVRKAPEYWLSGVAMKYRAGQFKSNLGPEVAKDRTDRTMVKEQKNQTKNVRDINRQVGNDFLAKLQRNKTT